MYVGRNKDGSIYGLWAVPQWKEQEELPDDDPAVVAHLNRLTPPRSPTRDAENAVQVYMDKAAQALGYDSILSAASYAISQHPVFGPQGVAFVKWRDAVWSHCYQALADIQTGSREAPTIDQLLAELPALVI